MTVQLNHTIVPARNTKESAAFLSEVLGLAEPFPFGPFLAVQVDTLTLDYVEVDDDRELESRHYAFLVSEEEFDQIFGRLQERGVSYWADPHATRPQEINTNNGGRGCYFPDPSGHWLEILTRPYGSGSS
jgi:catechol 2,3-dioxygenase-like lactoylglutathione lyase family enzyme